MREPSTVGPRTDLYAVGAVANWLLTGRTVFRGTSVVEVFAHHMHTAPEPLSRHVEGLPKELEDLVLACLSKQPSDRPASARALRGLLSAVPTATAWTEEAAHAWWDDFDRSPQHDARQPVSGTEKTLQVDLRDRADRDAHRLLTTVR